MAKKAIAKTQGGLPAAMADQIAGDAGAGGEGATTADMMIPFLAVLQKGSPQVDKVDGEFIEGAEQGMFFNSATRETYDGENGITLIPVMYRRSYDEWVLREAGGGYVGGRDASIMEETTANDRGQDILPNGNQVVLSGQWYVLIARDDGSVEQAVLSLSSTQLKKSRRLMSMLKGIQVTGPKGNFNPPFFYNLVNVVTVPEQNEKGSWFGVQITIAGNVFDRKDGEDLYNTAKSMYEAVKSGALKAAPPPGEGDDKDIPF